MNLRKCFSWISLLIPSVIYAFPWQPSHLVHSAKKIVNSNGLYFDISTGFTEPSVDHDQMYVTQPGWPPDTYYVHHVDDTWAFNLGLGWIWSTQRCACEKQSWFPYHSLGVEYGYSSPTKIKGNIDQFSLTQFDYYDFRYKIKQRHTFLLLGKTNFYRWKYLMPYAQLGLGTRWHKVNNYSEEPTIDIPARTSPQFSSHHQARLLYVLGAGLDFIIKENIWLGLGYRYDGNVRVNTGYGVGTFETERLKNRLYAHSVLAQLRFIF